MSGNITNTTVSTAIPTTLAHSTIIFPPPAIVASCYIVLFSIFAPLHCLYNAVFIGHPEYRGQSCFRIMFSLGVLNIIQLLAFGVQGLVMLFHWSFIEDGQSWAVTLLGSLYFVSFYLLAPLHLVLACNRLWVVWGIEPGSTNYASSTRLERYAVAAGVAASWLYGAGLLAFYLSPYVDIYYFSDQAFGIVYTELAENATVVSVADWTSEYLPDVSRAAAFVVYSAIILVLVKKVGGKANFHQQSKCIQRHTYSTRLSGDAAPLLSKPERAVLIQAANEFGVFALHYLYGHVVNNYYQYIDPKRVFLTLQMHSFLWNLLKLAISCVGPVLYSTTSPTLKHRALQLVDCRSRLLLLVSGSAAARTHPESTGIG